MRTDSGNSRREPPRVYDSYSGEYRPVSAGGRDFSREAAFRAERRERRRRHSLLLFYFILFFFVIAAAAIVSLTVLFKIETIQVEGTSRYTQEQIVAASGISKGDNLFLAHTREASQSIPQKLPYVGSVSVSRKFPASIVIRVGQESVCGAVTMNGKYVVIGSEGKVLEIVSSQPKNYPLIKGLAVQNAKVGSSVVLKQSSGSDVFHETLNALNANKFTGITGMDFTSPSKILIEYQGRIKIDFGLPSDLDYKVRYAKTLLSSGKITSKDKGTLNLSVAADNNTAYFDPDYGS